MTTNNQAFLEFKGLGKTFPGGKQPDVHAVADFNLIIHKGEFITVLGPSGCGKTTMLRMLAGFEQPTSEYHPRTGTCP